MSVLCGKDYDSNNMVPLNILQNGTLVSQLRYFRNNNETFIISAHAGPTVNPTALLTIWNPSNSLLKVGIFQIIINASVRSATTGVLRLTIQSLTSQPTGGETATAYNLKLGESNGALEYKKNLTSGYTGVNLLYVKQIYISTSSTDTDLIINENYLDELIEIPPGNGIVIQFENNSGVGAATAINVKFIETSSNIII